MAYGFQCFNTAGSYQIDGTYPQIALLRKVTISTGMSVVGSSGTEYSMGQFAMNSGEIAAVYSTSPVALRAAYNGYCSFLSTGVIGTSVDVYIFGQVVFGGLPFGFQVFNANGILVFDAAAKPLTMVGFPSGEGNFTYTAGRKYAAICCNQYMQIVDTLGGNGGAGFTHRVQVTRGFVKGISGGINISNILYYDNTDQLDPNQGALDESVPATFNSHVIVDVTYC